MRRSSRRPRRLLRFFVLALILVVAASAVYAYASDISFIASGFDETKNQSNLPDIDLSSWQYVLVNAKNPLPDGFVPYTGTTSEGYLFDSRAVQALDDFLDAGRKAGYELVLTSAYRSYDYQAMLYENKTMSLMGQGMSYEDAYKEAGRVVAKPGCSEHNLGLAADIVSVTYSELDEGYADTPEAIWLRETCADYGFILRYPKDKEDITGIIFEPWHFRYIGTKAASFIMDNELTLEEFLELY